MGGQLLVSLPARCNVNLVVALLYFVYIALWQINMMMMMMMMIVGLIIQLGYVIVNY